jgi:hypothetical protein
VLISATFQGHADASDPAGSVRVESYLRGRIRGKFVCEPSLDRGPSPSGFASNGPLGAAR